jgi:hypothetical protein
MMNWCDPLGTQAYLLDACQRGILFADVLRRRAEIQCEQAAKKVPNVLHFAAELVRDGRTLARPVNYGLVRIIPPAGHGTDPAKPPVIVVDPRAGHGPGIGGMKQDSEIGVALAAGHPCYFIGFLPRPVPGQTIEDVCRAEAQFVADVAARHPDAEGKPIVIANCQAGWQIMMMAAMRPDLAGPILLAGSPLSYWAGVRGRDPMRYLGGLLGGTWLTALSGDLGAGLFDGANLVANFESLNPANTCWTKPYNVYSKVDTEEKRFLDFETWWGSPVLMNASEMQWIADNLFVGNRLSIGELRTSDGVRIDLRNIRSPIIVFCSWGDDITPPPQALGWIADLYEHENEIIANGQTIVYTLHQTVGHLGIFVSGKVATKEHGELVSCMEMIDLLPPGLYEAVITEVSEDTTNRQLIAGRYLFQLERRTLDALRPLIQNDPADDARFAAVARLSQVNRALYETCLAPAIRAMATPLTAEALRNLHPNRLRFAMFGDDNPLMRPVHALAESVRQQRQPVSPGNPWLTAEKTMSSWITSWLKVWGDMRDKAVEMTFETLYGAPLIQALAGLDPTQTAPHRRIERDLTREAMIARAKAQLEARFESGGIEEAVARALTYVCLPQGRVDERGFTVLRTIRESRPPARRMTFERLKEVLREQFLLVFLDEERAIKALPRLLGSDKAERTAALSVLHRILSAPGGMSEEARRRLQRVEVLFEQAAQQAPEEEPAHA